MKTRNIADIYELTPIQEGFLFHSMLAPGSGVYVEQLKFIFKGDMDTEAFRQAWQAIIQRHAILRSTFHTEQVGKPIQVVHREMNLPLEELDWSGLSPDEQLRRWEELLREDRRKGFDFSRLPLMRQKLVKLGDDTWKFLWSFSHLILDGWSFGLAIQDFMNNYKACVAGRPLDLSPAPSYREYAAWWKREDQARAEPFWREQLQGYEPPESLQLGEVSPQPDGATHHYEELNLTEIADRLRSLGRHGQLTLNTMIQAAWMIVLSRYYGTADIVVGTTIAHRPSTIPGVELIMGPMITTMPVRAQLPPNQQLLAWLQQFQVQQATIREHANVPLVQVQVWSGVPQSGRLFESSVSFENVPLPQVSLKEAGLDLLEATYDGRPHYPLTLVIFPGTELPLRLIFERKRFSRSAVQRLLRHLHNVLDSMTANPHQLLGELDVLSPGEQRAVVEGFNPVEQMPVDRCLHETFEQRAAENPDAVALVFEEQSLTYRELNERGNKLAAQLRKLGVGLEGRVALLVERSLNTVIGILGILKAGGAYVPLDHTYPQERLSFMLTDSGASIVLTESGLLEKLPAHSGQTLCLDTEWARIDQESGENLRTGATPENLAYVLYTSGSTGRPKGTLVTHANVSRFFTGARKWLAYGIDDVWTLWHTYTFDIAGLELWGALLSGGQLVVVPYWVSRSAEAFYELLHQCKVTIINQTPSFFEQLITVDQAAHGEHALSLRYIILGGERVDFQNLRPWIERHGDERPQLINMYGPTETTIYVTYRRILEADMDSGSRSFIGVPLPDSKIYLLNQNLKPVPVGAVGELCISGPGVARGYLNLPDITAKRFVTDPYSQGPEARMYRTGDLGRYMEDGDIEYLGRADDQVKIRGYRIELGEIETLLRAHPAVKAAVAVVREDIPGDKRLVAYLVPAGTSLQGSELRTYLRALVPEYMVPSAFVWIDQIPLTPSRKLDRRALPRAEGVITGPAQYVTPRTVTEQRLAEIYANILSVPRVGVHDNLLDLGFHSLMAIRVITRIREVLKIDLPLRVLFELATIEALAAMIDDGGWREGASDRFSAVDLKAEIALDPAIQAAGTWGWDSDPQNLFLTGATGFLGGFLLEQLLRTTGATVHCLVRAANEREGKRRLVENLRYYGLWEDAFDSRVVPVVGDLIKPRFGLSERQFSRLVEEIDQVYHCGAHVNFLYSYQSLKSANVLGTQEVLRLCTERRVKPLHHISTVSVFGLNKDAVAMEAEIPAEPPSSGSGYAKSKWVAEWLIEEARKRGLPVAIYRPGRITGHSETSVWKQTDAGVLVIRACARIHAVPDLTMTLDMVPVDYVGKAIIALSRDRSSLGQNFHITGPQLISFGDIATVLSVQHPETRRLTFQEWFGELGRHLQEESGEELAAVLPVFARWVENRQSGRREPRYDSTNTVVRLGERLPLPIVDSHMMKRYVTALVAGGAAQTESQASD